MAAARATAGACLSAEQRRAELLEAAASEFAIAGFHGTSTEAIARRAGISHAYLFRLFPTKKHLCLAIAQRCFERTRDVFRTAAGAPPDDIYAFFAAGMLLNVAAAMDYPEMGDIKSWSC
jgi:AcrR family transcriptional regulator